MPPGPRKYGLVAMIEDRGVGGEKIVGRGEANKTVLSVGTSENGGVEPFSGGQNVGGVTQRKETGRWLTRQTRTRSAV